MFLGHRSNDATITITQDNVRKVVRIHEVNSAAEDVLGFTNEEIAGQPLVFLLPERIGNLLEEYVEFSHDGNDVGAVLSKVQSFCLTSKQQKELAFRLKVIRATPINGLDQFKLILQDTQSTRRTEAFRALLRENFKGHEVLDMQAGLPDRASIAKDIEFVMFYVNKGELKASVAIIEVNGFEALQQRHGEAEAMAAIRQASSVIRRNLRPDDVIGFLAPKRLALILFDTTPESSLMVLNRLRWLVAADVYMSKNKQPIPLTVSIGFVQMKNGGDKNILRTVEGDLDASPLQGNSVHEITLA
jgi:diguanylate cyclase (GGDEF)-like protein